MPKKISKYLQEDKDYKGPKGKLWKFRFLMGFIFLGFILVAIRLFNIQILNNDKYSEKAKRQHESKIDLRADRGSIYDRNSNLLATTFKTISVAVDPTLLKKPGELCTILSNNLGISRTRLLRKISNAKGSFVWLARGVNPNKIKELNNFDDKGLILLDEPKRNFPYRATGAQIIGFTNIDNKGISGIELEWDSLLIGRSGFMLMYRDGLGRLRPSPELPVVNPIHGNSIQLTIDVELQRIVEYELKQGIERTLASAGTVIAIKPETGEILAMASYPMFDPYNITKKSSEGMRLRGISDILEPGSTFKAITAAAALEEDKVTEDEIFDGKQGYARYAGGAEIRDVHGMGKVNFRTAMQNSSNIILGEVANRMEESVFYRYIRNFGFGLPTDIDMPGEVTGRVPKPKDFHVNSKRYLGHGYGLSATPLQIVNAYGALANGGKLMKPFIVKKMVNHNGEVINEFKPEKVRNVVSTETCNRVKDLLVSVVDSGSGKNAQVQGLKIAGKTGTSQKIVNGRYSKSDYNASFAGYFPADNPEIAMIVIIEKPRRSIYGGYNSAPIFKNIAARWMSGSYFKGSEIEIVKDSIVMPDLIGLNKDEAEFILDKYNLEYEEIPDEHFIYNQYPKPNQTIPDYEKVILTSGKLQDMSNDSTETGSHDVTGLPLRKAITILQSEGIHIDVNGNGHVRKQVWGKTKDGTLRCTLVCR